MLKDITMIEAFLSSSNLFLKNKEKFYLDLEKLIKLIKNNYYKGCSPATSTNFSFEIDIDNSSSRFFLMTRSGIDKEFCMEKDFLLVNEKGELLFKQKETHKPSAEAPLHIAIYNLFPKVRCILHSHSLYSTVLSKIHLKEKNIIFEGYELQKGIKGIETHEIKSYLPIIENSQDMFFLATRLNQVFASDDINAWGILLAGHGLYVWGESFEEAKRHLETYEFLLEATYIQM